MFLAVVVLSHPSSSNLVHDIILSRGAHFILREVVIQEVLSLHVEVVRELVLIVPRGGPLVALHFFLPRGGLLIFML